MKKLITICMALAIALAFVVPCSAATIEEYSYNGVVLPKLPDGTTDAYIMKDSSGNYYLYNMAGVQNDKATSYYPYTYTLENGEWVANETKHKTATVIWSSYTIKSSSAVAIQGSDYVVNLIEVAVNSSDFIETLEEMAIQLNVQNVVLVLALGITAIVGMVFMWWGVRKLTRAVFTAFRKGKISL